MASDNKLFTVTFCFSLLVHATVLVPVAPSLRVSLKKNPPPAISFFSPGMYQKTENKIKDGDVQKHPAPREKEAKGQKPTSKKLRGQPINQKFIRPAVNKKAIAHSNLRVEENSLSSSEKNSYEQSLEYEAFYNHYFEVISRQLRQSIVYPRYFSEGEIAVKFVLSSDGNLKSIEVIQDTSSNNSSLRETAMKIVKKASPFPPFPKDLRKSQLTFNIVICFREKS